MMALDSKQSIDSSARRPWSALLLSLGVIGLGQVYNGRWRFGLVLWSVLMLGLSPAFVYVSLWFPPHWVVPAMFILLLLMAVLLLFSPLQAWLEARRLTQYRVRKWQHWWVYVLLFFAANIVVLPVMSYLTQKHFAQSFSVSTGSMMPTLMRGDVFIADKRINYTSLRANIQRNDVVVFRAPQADGVVFVKRIIGVAGDEIRTEGDEVFVNNKALAWHTERDVARENKQSVHSLTVPDGEVFVIGDNRQNSRDSRQFGTVPVTDIVGQVRQVVWSKGGEGVRWSRLGFVPH